MSKNIIDKMISDGKLGKMPDKVVAGLYGINFREVCTARKLLGIDRFTPRKKKPKPKAKTSGGVHKYSMVPRDRALDAVETFNRLKRLPGFTNAAAYDGVSEELGIKTHSAKLYVSAGRYFSSDQTSLGPPDSMTPIVGLATRLSDAEVRLADIEAALVKYGFEL